jgi:hypothetical protein
MILAEYSYVYLNYSLKQPKYLVVFVGYLSVTQNILTHDIIPGTLTVSSPIQKGIGKESPN